VCVCGRQVRILDADHATAANVRVMIEFHDAGRTDRETGTTPVKARWTTVRRPPARSPRRLPALFIIHHDRGLSHHKRDRLPRRVRGGRVRLVRGKGRGVSV